MKSDVLETKCLECFQQISRFSGHTVVRPRQEMVVDRVGNYKGMGREERKRIGHRVSCQNEPETPVGATSSFEPSTICILCIWIAFITRRTHTNFGSNCRPEVMDPWCMLQRTWRRASWCRVSNRFAPALPLHVYIACTCIRATRSVCPPRMQSATMNSSSNEKHFPRECTLLPSSSSRAFLAFFRLSSRTSYRATIFFHPSVCLLFAPGFSPFNPYEMSHC